MQDEGQCPIGRTQTYPAEPRSAAPSTFGSFECTVAINISVTNGLPRVAIMRRQTSKLTKETMHAAFSD